MYHLTQVQKNAAEGFGAMMFDPADAGKAEEVVYTAIKTGYRLIDTAASYMNEVQVGNAIRRAIEEGITTREELFVVSKLWVQDMTDEETATKAIDTSLSNLGLEYIDLILNIRQWAIILQHGERWKRRTRQAS